MMTLIFGQLEHYFPQIRIEEKAINCHHNYVEKEQHYGKNVWVTRKGAIRARTEDMGIIPGSMGTKSYIVRGKGNKESFHSCSHGAGRKMSRRQAFNKFTMRDLKNQTLGVEMQRRKAIIDEIPEAYKNIDQVMKDQKDLVDIVHTLKQIVNVKGD
jgi:tRNA-splicing ligase RtcB